MIQNEAALIATMISQNDTYDLIAPKLTADMFLTYAPVYSAIQALAQKGQGYNVVVVWDTLDEDGQQMMGGFNKLGDMLKYANRGTIDHNIREVETSYILHQGTQIGQDLIGLRRETVREVLSQVPMSVQSVLDGVVEEDDHISTASTELVEQMEKFSKMDRDPGIPTGFHDLDRLTGGFYPGDLAIIAARPGMGKTSFMLKCMLHDAKQGIPVGLFSIEMMKRDIVAVMISQETGIDTLRMRQPRRLSPTNWEEIRQTKEMIDKLPIYIVDKISGFYDLIDKMRIWKRKHNIEAAYVDYLQMLESLQRSDNRTRQIEMFTRAMKSSAKSLDLPVICLSQLSRAVESRGGLKKPQLSDLRESGAIEQDADSVWFLYRPAYYDLEDDPTAPPNLGEVIIAKTRFGYQTTHQMSSDGRNWSELGTPVVSRTDTPQVMPRPAIEDEEQIPF